MRSDGAGAGWVLLPDDSPRMHWAAGGRTLCGRQLGAGVVVLPTVPRRAFSICVACRDAGAVYPIPGPGRPGDSGRPAVRRGPAVSARVQRILASGPIVGDEATGTVGSWKLPAGWVRLGGQLVWHRPHPERPDQVMCQLPLPAGTPVYRRRVGARRVCGDCDAVRAAALAELRDRDRRAAGGRPRPARRNRPAPLRVFSGGLPTLGRRRR